MIIRRKFHFDSAHKLINVGPPKCKNLHGHTYVMKVEVEGPVTNSMVIDFADLDRNVKEAVLDKWDHQYLNDVLPDGMESTVENLVTLAAELISDHLPSGINVHCVTIYEGLNSSAIWKNEGSN